jgi:DNA-binding NarL/FixJ family response regulator
MIKILIADDHAIVRDGLKLVLSEDNDMKVAGEASNANELYNLIEKENWDIIILDINMPGKSGLEALKDIKKKFPLLPVLILSMYDEEQYGLRAIKAGASGYLTKQSAANDLINAIRKIATGGKYISPALAEKLADSFVTTTKEKVHENLSDREYEVMVKIASGKSAEIIAEEMSISIHTVYSYRNRIMEKLKLKSNIEITHYAINQKMI